MNAALFSLVLIPFVAGASYHFGGPVLGTVWIGVILVTFLVVYFCSALFRAKT